MSRRNVKRVGMREREDKYQKDLQQHSRRMGWGVPVKTKQHKVKRKPKGKRGGKGKGKLAEMPILHRASSSNTVHPNHGTLDSSAKKSVDQRLNGKGEGGPWWENEFNSSRNPSPTPCSTAPKTTPLPPPSTTDSMLGVTIRANLPASPAEQDTANTERGNIVAFNPKDPLPDIAPSPSNPKSAPGAKCEVSDDYENDSAFDDDEGTTALDDPDIINDTGSIDTKAALQMVASNDPDNNDKAEVRMTETSQQASDVSMQEFKLSQMVDAALFASWKALPWQTRVCPMALEERESVRLLAAMVQEARRIRQWTKGQNEMAMDAAQREDKRFANWLMEERGRVREQEERETQRVQAYEENRLAKVQEFEARENARVSKVEELERTRMANWAIKEFWDVYNATMEAYEASLPKEGSNFRFKRAVDTAVRLTHLKREEARFSKEMHKEDMRLTMNGAQERATSQEIHEAEKDRVATEDYEHMRKTNAFWAAEIARATGEANMEDEEARERWLEEKSRVETEDKEEKGRVEAWETLQYKVMKAAMANVIRLLAPDTAVVDFEDEVEKSKYYTGAYKKRCKLQKNKFQKQRYLAAKEAESTSKRWLGALKKWRQASVDVHERRRNYEKERVETHMQEEVDRINDMRRKEQDRVAYAWDRECQRVTKWREHEKELFKDLATEWRRENTEGEKFLHEVVQECGGNVANADNIIEERIKAAGKEHVELLNDVKKGMEGVAEKGTEREREEREKVREFEGAQLLMVLGVSEQLTKIAGDSIVKFGESTEVKEATFIAAESAVSEEIDRFAKSENTRISAAYRMETERASKRAREEGVILEREWEKVEGNLKKSCDEMNTRTEVFTEEMLAWANERGSDLKAKTDQRKEEGEQVTTNELLRMFGQEGFKKGMDCEEVPKPGKKMIRRIITKTKTVQKDPENEEAKGKRVEVFWESEDAWFEGKVDAYGEQGYHVAYDDGDEEWVATSSKNYRFLDKVDAQEDYEEEIEEEVDSNGIEGPVSTEELHAWRVKCTLGLCKVYNDIIDKELERQAICLKGFIDDKMEGVMKVTAEGQQRAAKWLYDAMVSAKVVRGEVLDNESTRVNNRLNHELKDWGNYVSATTLTVRNNLNYIHGLRSSFNEWVNNVHYKQRSDGIATVRDLCKTCDEGMKDIDGDVLKHLKIIEKQFQTDTEGVARKAEGKVHEEVNVVLAKIEEEKGKRLEVIKALASEVTSSLENEQNEHDQTVQRVKVEVEKASAGELRSVGDSLSRVMDPGDLAGAVSKVKSRASQTCDEVVQELFSFAEKRKENLEALKDEVKGGVDDHAVKATEKIRGVLSGCGKQLDDKFNNTASLVNDSLKVSEDKIGGLCKERSGNVKARVQKYELQITLSLNEDLEALKVHGSEFQAVVKSCPGNCDVEEELKVIESVNQRRKQGLKELEASTKRVMSEEINKEDLTVNKHNEEHSKDLRKIWEDFTNNWKTLREKIEVVWKEKVEEAVVLIEQMKVDAEDGRVEEGLGLVEEFEHLVEQSDLKSSKIFDDVVVEVEAVTKAIEERVQKRVGEVQGIKSRIEERIKEAEAKAATEEEEAARRQREAAQQEGENMP